jgi:plasmid maintenance system antidote protein VapI
MEKNKFERVGSLINCGIIKELSQLWDYISKEDLAHSLRIETTTFEKLLEDPGEITYDFIIKIGKVLHCDGSLLGYMILDYWKRKFGNSAY